MKLKPLSCLGKHSCGTWSFLKSSLEWSDAVVARHAWMLACATLTCFKGLVGSVPPNIMCLYTSRCACRGVVTRGTTPLFWTRLSTPCWPKWQQARTAEGGIAGSRSACACKRALGLPISGSTRASHVWEYCRIAVEKYRRTVEQQTDKVAGAGAGAGTTTEAEAPDTAAATTSNWQSNRGKENRRSNSRSVLERLGGATPGAPPGAGDPAAALRMIGRLGGATPGGAPGAGDPAASLFFVFLSAWASMACVVLVVVIMNHPP